MNAKKLAIALGTLLIAIFLGLFGATYVLVGFMHTKANQLATSKAQVAQLTAQQSTIARSKKDIATYTPLEKIAQSIVPQDKDQAATVRELTNIASANNVTLTTITFPNSTLGAGSASAAAPAPAAAVPSKPAAASTTNLSQLTKVASIPGVYSMQLVISNNSNNTVSFNQLSGFLRGLENNRRTAIVNTISIQPQPQNHAQLIFTLGVTIYIKP